MGVDPRPAGPGAALLFPVALALGVTVGMALDVILSALMVNFGWSVWEVGRWRGALATVLSGALLPLSVLPWGLADVLVWLPPAAMAWAPLSIYTGASDPLRLLAVQLFWAVTLWLAAGWLWRRNRQKVVIYGRVPPGGPVRGAGRPAPPARPVAGVGPARPAVRRAQPAPGGRLRRLGRRARRGHRLGDAAAGGSLRRHRRVAGPQVLFMLGYATVVSGLMNMFFGYNVLFISRRLGRGQLDHTLIQPQPIWLSLLTEGFMPFSGSPMLLPGIALMVWSAPAAGADGHAGLAGAAGAQPGGFVGDRAGVLVSCGAAWRSGRRAPPKRSAAIGHACCTSSRRSRSMGWGRCC